jgi:hypothetical protein
MLLAIRATHTVSDLVREIKKGSHSWAADRERNFAWQSGYGAFSAGTAELPRLTAYIENQEEHHREVTSFEEMHRLSKEHNVAYDPQYLSRECGIAFWMPEIGVALLGVFDPKLMYGTSSRSGTGIDFFEVKENGWMLQPSGLCQILDASWIELLKVIFKSLGNRREILLSMASHAKLCLKPGSFLVDIP